MKKRLRLFWIWLLCISLLLPNFQVISYASEVSKETETLEEKMTGSLDVSEYIIKNGGFLKENNTEEENESGELEFYVEEDLKLSSATFAKQALEQTIEEVDVVCDLSEYDISTENVADLVVEIANENPRYFYVDYSDIQYTVEEDCVTEVRFVYIEDETDVKASLNKYDAAVNEILSGVSLNWSDFEKILYVNDYLAENCQYDLTYSKYSAYDIIVNKTGVCQAYAEAYQELLTRLGIPCQLITSRSLNHAWNLVELNGKYYHVDVTYNDPMKDRLGRVRHQFLLKSTAYFKSKEGGHLVENDWSTHGVSYNQASDTSYDDYLWNDIDVAFKNINGTWYTVSGSEDAIVSYSCNGKGLTKVDKLISLNYRWYVWGDPYRYWVGYFGGFGAYGTDIYYASPTTIYAYNVATGTSSNVHTLSASKQAEGNIYGLRVTPAGKIEYILSTAPQQEGTVYAINVKNNAPGKKYYILKLEGNGSTSGSMSNRTCYMDKSYTLTENLYKRKGYKFLGWNTKADGTGKSYADGAKIKNLTKTNGKTVKLYAQWERIKYKITYELNGGTNHKDNKSTYYVTSGTRTLQKPTRTGYTFKGWYSDSKFTNKVTQIKKGSTGNKKFYAKWILNKYNITFDGNGATSGKMSTLKDRKYANTHTLSKNTFKRKGYEFVGWNTKADGSGKSYGDKAKVKNLTKVNGKTVKLYAQWERIKYKITYELNGGKNHKDNKNAYYVTSNTRTLQAPTRKGYTFKGWYSDAKLTKKATEIKKGSTGNKKFYAKWSRKK